MPIKVLIVDDSRIFHGSYMLYLKSYNCSFAHALNGQEALDVLAVMDDIDLILLDVNMPVMNGIQFLEKAGAVGITGRIPVIIVSTEGKEADVLRGLRLGAKGYLKKPFQPTELQELVGKILRDAVGT